MTNVWHDVNDELPDWGDHGPAMFQLMDGTFVKGTIEIDEFFNGEDEVPVATCRDLEGNLVSLFSLGKHCIVRWRMRDVRPTFQSFPCELNKAGREWLGRELPRLGRVVGESRDKKCWAVVWDGLKTRSNYHKDFIAVPTSAVKEGVWK